MDITGVLLAGGKSSRMGKDKRFLELDGASLFQRVLSVLGSTFPEVLVSVADPLPESLQSSHQSIEDLMPGCGSMGGLYSGLKSASHTRVFVVACDMPLLNPAVIEKFVSLGGHADIVMTQSPHGPQPMHALYSKRCLSYLEAFMADGRLSIQGLLEVSELTTRLVSEDDFRSIDPHLLSFLNLNTPADLEFARKVLAEQKRDKALHGP